MIIAAIILATNVATYIGITSLEDNNVIRYEQNQEETEQASVPAIGFYLLMVQTWSMRV